LFHKSFLKRFIFTQIRTRIPAESIAIRFSGGVSRNIDWNLFCENQRLNQRKPAYRQAGLREKNCNNNLAILAP